MVYFTYYYLYPEWSFHSEMILTLSRYRNTYFMSTIDINLNALDSFRVAFTDDRAIVNVDKETSELHQNGTIKSANIFRFARRSTTKAANNEVRACLLKSLGDTYGINGASVRADGRISFSREFMDKLEKLLGKELKRGDFGIGSDGTVTSGKPLTARRIRAIINKIDQQYADSHSSSPAIDSTARQKTEESPLIAYKDFVLGLKSAL